MSYECLALQCSLEAGDEEWRVELPWYARPETFAVVALAAAAVLFGMVRK